MKHVERLNTVLDYLWELGGVGATCSEIAMHLGLKSQTHLRRLLNELIDDGKVVTQSGFRTKTLSYYAAHTSFSQVKKIQKQTPLYDPISKWTFDESHCFLCGTLLDQKNRTEEHVFPKWLQRKYNLWNERLGLLNGTEIPYKSLAVPCCQTCNLNYLSYLEKTVNLAHEHGISAFQELPQILLFQWVAKIFYCILFRELSLLQDRSDPRQGFIFTEDELRTFATLHYFLQSVRLPFVFRGFQPWSIFVLNTMKFGDSRDFYFRDTLHGMVLSIRMGEIGIIACLEDGGAQAAVAEEFFEKLKRLSLHPLQFDEVTARVIYSAFLMNRIPKYVMSVPDETEEPTLVIGMPLMGLSTKPIFDEWNSKEYASVLFQCWQEHNFEWEFVYQEPGLVRSFLVNEQNRFTQLNERGEINHTLDITIDEDEFE